MAKLNYQTRKGLDRYIGCARVLRKQAFDDGQRIGNYETLIELVESWRGMQVPNSIFISAPMEEVAAEVYARYVGDYPYDSDDVEVIPTPPPPERIPDPIPDDLEQIKCSHDEDMSLDQALLIAIGTLATSAPNTPGARAHNWLVDIHNQRGFEEHGEGQPRLVRNIEIWIRG